MAKDTDEHAGSGLDKPDPKGIVEKLTDTVKSVLPKPSTDKPQDTGNGTVQKLPK